MDILQYTCFRCHYQTKDKFNMRTHFKRKKQCPAVSIETDIELSDEVQDKILTNRVFFKPVDPIIPIIPLPKTIINNYTTNTNIMNNLITSIDDIDKLTKYLSFTNRQVQNVDKRVDTKYDKILTDLDNEELDYDFELHKEKFIEIVGDITLMDKNDLSSMDIFYDSDIKKIKIFNNDEWEFHLEDNGLKSIIELIRNNYLFMYEIFLAKKLFNIEISRLEKEEAINFLKIYFNFLAIFDILPYMKNRVNSFAIDPEITKYKLSNNNKFEVEEKLMLIYYDVVDNLKKTEINKYKKIVLDILIRNSKQNLKELNKEVLSLLMIDKDFEKFLKTETISD